MTPTLLVSFEHLFRSVLPDPHRLVGLGVVWLMSGSPWPDLALGSTGAAERGPALGT